MINQRIFSANVGEPSTGNKGPDAIETDIDNLLANDQELLGITGDKANLTTDNKTNLVAAINEHEAQINSLDANKANKVWGEQLSAVLQNGYTGGLLYQKNDANLINMWGYIIPGVKAFGTPIATLSTGYKPKNITPLSVFAANGVSIDGIYIDSNGIITVGEPAASNANFTGSCWINATYNGWGL